MEIQISDFEGWRLKKIVTFIICMSCIMIIGVAMQEGMVCGAGVIMGVMMYGYIIEFPYIREKYKAKIDYDEDFFYIKVKGKVYCLEKEKIKNVEIQEISYGEGWLATVGYRLNVYTEKKKYYFDSAVKCGERDNSRDIFRLYQLLTKEQTMKN